MAELSKFHLNQPSNFLPQVEKNLQNVTNDQLSKLNNDKASKLDSTSGVSGSKGIQRVSGEQELSNNDSLTIFLGGAGMVGNYNKDMIDAFKEVGIKNPVYGNYSALPEGWDAYIKPIVDNLVDAANVVHYNQAPDDPILFTYKLSNGEEYECNLSPAINEFNNLKCRIGQV